MPEIYGSSYYNGFRDGSRRSAEVVAPLIVDWIAPASVIDLGCGTGDWLSVFKQMGVATIKGVDGDHVDLDQLAIPRSTFAVHDLSAPYQSDQRYDLTLSVEVGEHLPADSAGALVRSLTDLAPVVLFSAAIPNQPGAHHVNCQWPRYWAELFAERGFVCIDALRMRLWNDRRVDSWYRQNLVIYVSQAHLSRYPKLQVLYKPDPDGPLSLVHPELFQETYKYLLEWGVEWERKYWDLWKQVNTSVSEVI